jgi:predicted negative regulator of RcsB-dependent stress response
MNQDRVNFRLLENIHKVTLDHGDEITDIKKDVEEIKSYFSPKMLIIYFTFILAQVITVSFYIAHQESKIEEITKQLEKIKK